MPPGLSRTLGNQRDRALTIMMNPFMSCGARLPVYALFAAAFFPTGGQNLVFLLYLIGITFAVLTGLILKNTLLKGDITPFVMELPPYHLPTVKAVLLRTYDRLKTFLFKAGRHRVQTMAFSDHCVVSIWLAYRSLIMSKNQFCVNWKLLSHFG